MVLWVCASIPCHSPSLDPCSPCRSRSIVQINASIRFEPSKINIFTKDCKRNGKDATCMSAFICFTAIFLSAHFQTASVGKWHGCSLDENPNSCVIWGSNTDAAPGFCQGKSGRSLACLEAAYCHSPHPFLPSNLSLPWLV